MTKTLVATAEPDDQIDVWLTMDPETLRVTMQDEPFQHHHFPAGLRGLNWEKRQATISKKLYEEILGPDFDYDRSDTIHRELWSNSGDTPWPGYVI